MKLGLIRNLCHSKMLDFRIFLPLYYNGLKDYFVKIS